LDLLWELEKEILENGLDNTAKQKIMEKVYEYNEKKKDWDWL